MCYGWMNCASKMNVFLRKNMKIQSYFHSKFDRMPLSYFFVLIIQNNQFATSIFIITAAAFSNE